MDVGEDNKATMVEERSKAQPSDISPHSWKFNFPRYLGTLEWVGLGKRVTSFNVDVFDLSHARREPLREKFVLCVAGVLCLEIS